MVREVDLALRYFQDAVSKRTYEMLPGMYTRTVTGCPIWIWCDFKQLFAVFPA